MSKRRRDIICELSTDRIMYLIEQYIHNSKHRAIVSDRLLDGVSYQELQDKYGYCDTQIKTILRRSEEILIRMADVKE